MHAKSSLLALSILASYQASAYSLEVDPKVLDERYRPFDLKQISAPPKTVSGAETTTGQGPHDTNACGVDPTRLDPRYLRSGTAEKALQIPGVLPPEAPIPATTLNERYVDADGNPIKTLKLPGVLPAQVEKIVRAKSDSNVCPAVEPTVITEEYIRSGRAEKTLKLPSVLPPEAPVPDALKTQATATQDAEPAKPAAPEPVEAPRDTNMFQLKPTILDEEYYRSGRAEHSLQLPGVLPPGAPIPNSF